MPEDNELSEMIDSDSSSKNSEIQFCYSNNEEKILAAKLRAFESGSLTPLIKEELRCTIQSRRIAAGKGELRVEEFKKPPKKKLMTDEEKKRAQVRRLQNREAAQRFRQRQKDQACYLSDKIKRLEKSSTSLQNEMKRLKDERDELKQMLEDHLSVCTKTPTIPEINSSSFEDIVHQFTNHTTRNDMDYVSLPTPQCPDTSESTSSVFFPDENNSIQNNHVMYNYIFEGLDETYEVVEDNGSIVIQDFVEYPEVSQEMVIGDGSYSDSEYNTDQRLDSCSSVDTVSNYSSISSDNFYIGDTTIELSSSLAATFSIVQTDGLYYQSLDNFQPFDNCIVSDDVLVYDSNTS